MIFSKNIYKKNAKQYNVLAFMQNIDAIQGTLMLFCEKCNYLTHEKRCPCCKNKKLRDVRDNDFCYFIDLQSYYFDMFENALKHNNIDVVGVPYYPGNVVVFSNAGKASGRKVYIRYKNIDAAREIYSELFEEK